MKSDITSVVWVSARVVLPGLIEGVKVITQAKSSPMGKVVLHLQRAGQTQQSCFIEIFICLSAPRQPYALRFSPGV